MGLAAAPGQTPNYLRPFLELLRWIHILSFGKTTGGYLLCAVTAVNWIVALILTQLLRHAKAVGSFTVSEYGAMAAATAIVLGWIVFLPTHTAMHAMFIVRVAIVPVALGGVVLIAAVLAALQIWGAKFPLLRSAQTHSAN